MTMFSEAISCNKETPPMKGRAMGSSGEGEVMVTEHCSKMCPQESVMVPEIKKCYSARIQASVRKQDAPEDNEGRALHAMTGSGKNCFLCNGQECGC